MADLFFPQLNTGAVAQYPIRKVALTRTISNVLPGGDILVYPDDAASRTTWNWEYAGLTDDELGRLQNFFDLCAGPLKSFTFLAPTGNLLSSSSSFQASAWQLSSAITLIGESAGPLSTATASTLINNAQTVQELEQTLNVPGNYSYCYSLYVSSVTPQEVTLFRRGMHSEAATSFNAGPDWKRIWTTGNLQDESTGFSVGLKLSPGQELSISAAQLEAQPGVSPYRNTLQNGDIYPNAHWASEELNVRYLGPNSISVSVSIEA